VRQTPSSGLQHPVRSRFRFNNRRWPAPQGTLAAAAASAEASRRLAAAVPGYEALAAWPAGASQPAWLADPALAARVQFLCSMLAPCARQLQQVGLWSSHQCMPTIQCSTLQRAMSGSSALSKLSRAQLHVGSVCFVWTLMLSRLEYVLPLVVLAAADSFIVGLACTQLGPLLCCTQADLQRLAPIALLFVQHPAPAFGAAGHSLFGSLLQVASC
jgi:hypothetical protein